MAGRCFFWIPSSDIRARMPPSPSLSTRIAKDTYLTVVMMNIVHKISDSMPRIMLVSGLPPARSRTVLNV